jgi:acylphosphatase
MTIRSVHVVISGRVQGVWYRGWAVAAARKLGLTGWVRNRPDGTVEATFHGPAAAIDEMLNQCRSGPPIARVDDIQVTDTDDDAPEDFTQR